MIIKMVKMVYVFKTSVKTKKDVRQLTSKLNEFIPDAKWNFDLEDCDNILRVDSQEVKAQHIIDFLNAHKYDCIELF